MPLIETKGAASAQGFGEFAQQTAATYIEDVFSTWLYTGTSATQTITNNINLSGKGGLIWTKSRTENGRSNAWFDTARGINAYISSNLISNITVSPSGDAIASFNANGYTLGADTQNWGVNNTGQGNLVSWTFRKQPKFFDIVTYTGNGTTNLVSHSLDAVPGFVAIKCTSNAANWWVTARRSDGYYSSQGNLNLDAAFQNNGNLTAAQWGLTSTTIDANLLGPFTNDTNQSGRTYVAYLFAHNAGGFGLTGSDNVISCGSFSVPGGIDADITLGYEPQWVLVKAYDTSSNWVLTDNMRGMFVTTSVSSPTLLANAGNAENPNSSAIVPTSTGFNVRFSQLNGNYIYIAIRRGPMKVPTSGTSVYVPSQWPGTYGSGNQYTGFPVDSLWVNYLSGSATNTEVYDRLRRASSTNSSVTGGLLSTSTTSAQDNANGSTQGWFNDRFNQSRGSGNIYYALGRAPGFFDVVCYTGTGSTQSVNHNLGVTPNLIIVKRRTSNGYEWVVQNSTTSYINLLFLNQDSGYQQDTTLLGVATSTTFEVRNNSGNTNTSGESYVAYLFATCAGVSKVGSYTSTGAAQTINCGFTGGARFVLIKRTNSTGDWYVYDSARGISSSTDPYILLNSSAAEVTGTNYVDTDSTGFKLGNNTPVNTNGGAYIFLAIA